MPESETPSLSRKEAIVLDLLVGAGDRYGLQLVEESGGRLKRGTVYVTLSRMEEKGFVESRPEERDPHRSGIPRRLYRISGLGQSVLSQIVLSRGSLGAMQPGFRR